MERDKKKTFSVEEKVDSADLLLDDSGRLAVYGKKASCFDPGQCR